MEMEDEGHHELPQNFHALLKLTLKKPCLTQQQQPGLTDPSKAVPGQSL